MRVEVDEGASVKTLRRPALQRALAAVEGCEALAAGLAAAKFDRLSRSVRDFAELLERSKRRGWCLAVLDIAVDTFTPLGSFTAHVMSAAAELERKLIGVRTREALAVRREQGMRLGRPKLPIGELEREVYRLRRERRTWQSIADALNQRGEPTRRGGAHWRVSSVQALARRAEA